MEEGVEIIVINCDSSGDEDSVVGYVYLTPPAKSNILFQQAVPIKQEYLTPLDGLTDKKLFSFELEPNPAPPAAVLTMDAPPAAFDTVDAPPAETVTIPAPPAETVTIPAPPAETVTIPAPSAETVTIPALPAALVHPDAPPPVIAPNPILPVPPPVAEAFIQGITTLVYKGDSNGGQDKLEALCQVARLTSSFHPGIIPRVPQELVPNVVVNRELGGQEFGIGNLVNPVQDLMSPLTHSLFGCIFKYDGVTRVTNASSLSTENSRGEPCPTAAPFHFILVPLPTVNKCPSILNNRGQHEFKEDGSYFQNFWKNHVVYHSRGDITSWLHLAVKVSECLLGMNLHMAHSTGLESLSKAGPLIGVDMLYMALYGGYCHAFRYFMTLDVTICARAYGFCPIFLMTNTLIEQTPRGVNKTHLVCCDWGVVSFLSMIGLWKQNSVITDDVILMGLTDQGLHLCITLIHSTQPNSQFSYIFLE